MNDIVALLRAAVKDEAAFVQLVRDLEDAPSTNRNLLFREFIRRIAKAGAVPPRDPGPRGELLEMIEAAERTGA